MKVKTIGLDLAKNVFQVHGADEQGRKVFNRQLKHSQMMEFFVRLERCTVVMEACSSAHHWARKLTTLGHTAKLIAPQHVKPFVKTNKMRGLLAEFGVRIPKGVSNIGEHVPDALEDASNELPSVLRIALLDEYKQFKALGERIAGVQKQIDQWHRSSAASQALEKVPGIGVLTATALVAHAGDPDAFANGSQVSAWLGIVPKQHSSGGKTQLLGISKNGDSRLRTLLIHGARAVVTALKRKLASGTDPARLTSTERWLAEMLKRRHTNVVCVALANKNARTAWAVLKHGRPYEPGHVSLSPRARAALATA